MAIEFRRPKLAFYGDDFTRSTDALEVLAFAGLRVALLVEPPTDAAFVRVGALDATGVAGDSRAMTPAQMGIRLPAIFDAVARCGAPIVDYKVCSTFDSAKTIDSIGHAMRLARPHFGDACIPIVGGTPALKRYCLCATLFARSATDDRIPRIDRHPIMRFHPLMPMHERDLRTLIGEQGGLDVEGVGFPELDCGFDHAQACIDALLTSSLDSVLFDAATPAHMATIGHLLDRWLAARPPLFVVGPSGVEYALTQWWRELQTTGEQPLSIPDVNRAEGPVLAVSGSGSPLSAIQIDAAIAGGFEAISVDTVALVDDDDARAAAAESALVETIISRLQRGCNVIACTARGPGDGRIAEAISRIESSGRSRDDARCDRRYAARQCPEWHPFAILAEAAAGVGRRHVDRDRRGDPACRVDRRGASCAGGPALPDGRR